MLTLETLDERLAGRFSLHRIGDTEAALERLVEKGFVIESSEPILHYKPTALGERLISVITGEELVPESVPELPDLVWALTPMFWQVASYLKCDYHVFLSHCQEDRDGLVEPVHRSLIAKGLKPFLDIEDYYYGRESRVALRDGILDSRYVIFFITDAMLNSARGWWVVRNGIGVCRTTRRESDPSGRKARKRDPPIVLRSAVRSETSPKRLAIDPKSRPILRRL